MEKPLSGELLSEKQREYCVGTYVPKKGKEPDTRMIKIRLRERALKELPQRFFNYMEDVTLVQRRFLTDKEDHATVLNNWAILSQILTRFIKRHRGFLDIDIDKISKAQENSIYKDLKARQKISQVDMEKYSRAIKKLNKNNYKEAKNYLINVFERYIHPEFTKEHIKETKRLSKTQEECEKTISLLQAKRIDDAFKNGLAIEYLHQNRMARKSLEGMDLLVVFKDVVFKDKEKLTQLGVRVARDLQYSKFLESLPDNGRKPVKWYFDKKGNLTYKGEKNDKKRTSRRKK